MTKQSLSRPHSEERKKVSIEPYIMFCVPFYGLFVAAFSPLTASNFHDNAPLTKKRNGEITENINYLKFRIIKTLLRSGGKMTESELSRSEFTCNVTVAN